MKYYLYILKTVSDTLYCGIAKDFQKRFEEHKIAKGAKYTKSHKPLCIVYVDEFENKSQALKEEYRIKKTLTKKEKLILIEQNKEKTKKIMENTKI